MMIFRYVTWGARANDCHSVRAGFRFAHSHHGLQCMDYPCPYGIDMNHSVTPDLKIAISL